MTTRRILPLLFALLLTSSAHAQDASASAQTTTTTTSATDTDRAIRKKEPMGVFAIGFKFGVAHVSTGKVDNPTYLQGSEKLPQSELEMYGLTSRAGCDPVDRQCRTAARRGYHIAVPIQIGGSGVGFRVEPYVTLASTAQAYGVYTGPTFEFHLAEPLYFGFGFGLKAAWVNADGWRYAADIYGRIPAWLTLYVSDGFAFVLEGAFGGGASGYVSYPRNIINPSDNQPIARRSDITFGFGRTWDFTIGVRFP